MQPHSAAIILAFHRHYFFDPNATYFSVQAVCRDRKTGGPGELFFSINLRKSGTYSWSVDVGGDIVHSNIKGCSTEIKKDSPKDDRFRLGHRGHSNISEEEWSASKEEIYKGRFRSGEPYLSSEFDNIRVTDGRYAEFRETGGAGELWRVTIK